MARFEQMLMAQHADPRVRNRMVLSMMGALALTAFGLAFSWTIEHLGIDRVDAPHVDAALLFDFSPMTPPPAAAPPPRPATAAATPPPEEPDVRDDDPDPDPVDVDLDLDPVPQRDATPAARTVPGVPGGDGDGTAASTCRVPPCIGPSTIGVPWTQTTPPPIRKPKVDDEKVMAGIAAVRAAAIYAPDPDTAKLARTQAGTFDRRAGRSTVEFCVDTRGHVASVKTTKKFGDPDVDRICRQTVETWRFRPFMVDGQARKACTSVTFDLRFD